MPKEIRMNISLEISMYPLADDFIPAIQSFIDFLANAPEVEVKTNTMSTQVFGEIDPVMNTLRDGLKESYMSDGKAVFVLKIINSDLRP